MKALNALNPERSNNNAKSVTDEVALRGKQRLLPSNQIFDVC